MGANEVGAGGSTGPGCFGRRFPTGSRWRCGVDVLASYLGLGPCGSGKRDQDESQGRPRPGCRPHPREFSQQWAVAQHCRPIDGFRSARPAGCRRISGRRERTEQRIYGGVRIGRGGRFARGGTHTGFRVSRVGTTTRRWGGNRQAAGSGDSVPDRFSSRSNPRNRGRCVSAASRAPWRCVCPTGHPRSYRQRARSGFHTAGEPT